MNHRWPTSLHSQTEALFHGIRSIREKKKSNPFGIHSFGSWDSYRSHAHRFVDFMIGKDRTSLLDTRSVHDDMAEYLEHILTYYAEKKRSRQTMETLLSALGKFEYALNRYIEMYYHDVPLLESEQLRLEYYARSRSLLRKSSRIFYNRAYPDPVQLIANIRNKTFQLQASLQYEGGLRAEGVGAPSNQRLKNPLTASCLRGIINDPVSRMVIGIVATVEKGGKETEHYVSLRTYRRLEQYLKEFGKLESDYFEYVAAINQAACVTGQYSPGRGSHGLKHNFAQERYLECIDHGLTHEQALQQTSLETSHFRLRETLTYTRG